MMCLYANPQSGRRLLRSLLLAAIVLTLFGCSTTGLPDYAAPSMSVVRDGELDLSDVITYRQLERADFKGTQPPSNFDERMAAVTCVYTRPVVDESAVEIKPLITADGQRAYDITYNNLSYRALMNRNCSWWNTGSADFDQDYVLQHEQIHFALFEIAAREWSEMPALTFQIKADDSDAMKDELQTLFEQHLQRQLEVLVAQNRRFDEETSLGHDPLKQNKWLRMVRSKLPSDDRVEAGVSDDP